jgi:acyl-CoA dehydrogenase
MDFGLSPRATEMQQRLRDFMAQRVLPQHQEWLRQSREGYPLGVTEPLKTAARDAGLWNLFLPGLREHEPGVRLSNLEYAPLAEVMGRVPWSPEVFNCNAPDTGNMELLHLFASPEQYQRWLRPLLEGSMRSAFSMTEPEVASSDATNVRTTIKRDGDQYVINGRKWFSTGILHPHCRFTIVLGVSDEEGEPHARHSMAIVPLETPGFEIVRNVPVMNHLAVEGHCEVVFRDVRVPAANLLGQEGHGFRMAQARLGPGRIHHCMRTMGQCELALELMCERALDRKAFGRALADYANIKDWIGYSRVEIDQARLLVLRAAWLMDTAGSKDARVDVAAIKLVAGQLQTRVLDRAIQVFGAMGLTPDTPLASLWTKGRTLRFVDGPDEVHLRTIARSELARARANPGANAAYFPKVR